MTNVLFVTLTFDTKISTIRQAWETFGEDFNNWVRNLRKKFGKISYLRCWERSKKAYPHAHILMIFHEYKFKIAFSHLKKSRRVYRIVEKGAFERSWHSFIDVQAVRKMREGITYVSKYLTKTRSESQTQVLTLALCWLFKKRSFAVSGDFHEILYTIIEAKHRLVQTDLFGNKLQRNVEWIFIGIFSASALGIKHNRWRKVITDRKILFEILQ